MRTAAFPPPLLRTGGGALLPSPEAHGLEDVVVWRMVMRTGVQTPVLPLGTCVLPLCAGGVQRAASAVSCGWCGSIRRAWRAKGGAHGSLPAAAPPHRRRCAPT